ncbi:hypothetical protein [Algivirga pacifica]|uniref:Outer membrane protein beta-barrel domain-containing protein n=1 Tax=Algivirga pacifica TaxID=1162670 RepID=A0ABP9D9G1_9BACT
MSVSCSSFIKKYLLLLFFLALWLLGSNSVQAQDRKWYIPSHAKVQYAGITGWLAVGPGYEIGKKNWWQIDALYGYVPESIGGQRSHHLSLKNTFKLIQPQLSEKFKLFPTLGLTTSFDINGDADWQLASLFYPGYYDITNAIVFYPFGGIGAEYQLSASFIDHIGFFAEGGAYAPHLQDLFIGNVKAKEIFSLGLGINLFF